MRSLRFVIPWSAAIVLLVIWAIAAPFSHGHILPGPWKVARGLGELARTGCCSRYVVASLFRVTWGYLSRSLVGIPLGPALGWWRRGELAVNPMLQMLRPISPLAWIPIAILWFGVGDVVGDLPHLPRLAAAADRDHDERGAQHRSASTSAPARNFGLSAARAACARVLFPAILPQLIVGMRIALGMAWLVVVAAEMIAVNSGLGFLIVDARNAGNRYDLVVAGMVLIGADRRRARPRCMRRLERLALGALGDDAAASRVRSSSHGVSR